MRDFSMMRTLCDSTPLPEALTVRTIIKQFLDANGYDGLYHPALCACSKDNLIPCDEVSTSCMAGYFRHPRQDEEPMDLYIGPEKEGV